MKTLLKVLAVLVLPAVLMTPQADAVLSATMFRKVVVEQLLLLTCGFSTAWAFPWRRWGFLAPAGVAAATLVILYWMVPRSVDLTQIDPAVRAVYVVSLFAAGYLFWTCLPWLPGVVVSAYAIYLSSMVVAVGLLYASQTTLWCSAYTIDIQHAFGKAFATLGLIGYAISLVFIPGWVRRPSGSPRGTPV